MKRVCLLLIIVVVAGLTACATKTVRTRLDGPAVILQESVLIPQYEDNSPVLAMHVAWHPNGQEFAVIDYIGHIAIFNVRTKRFIRRLPKSSSPDFWKRSLAYSHDGRYLAMTGLSIICIFDAQTGKAVRDIVDVPVSGQGAWVSSLIFSPDSRFLAASYRGWFADGVLAKDTLAVYPVKAGDAVFTYRPSRYHSTSHISTNVLYSVDGKQLFLGRASLPPFAESEKTGEPFRYFNFIDYIDSQTGELIESITPVHTMDITALALSPDGCYIASGTDTGEQYNARHLSPGKWEAIHNKDPVKLWDIRTRRIVREYPVLKAVEALAISPDGHYLAVHHNLQIAIFDFVTGKHLQTVELGGKPGASLSQALAFSLDSKILAIPLDNYVHLLHLQ